MCTVSWRPEPDGYVLCFNRDERRTRLPASPPAPGRRAGVPFLAPTDGEAGGTWIGVNALGLTVCLANRYDAPAPRPTPDRISRGLLVAALLDAGSVAEVETRVAAERLDRYDPFTLVACEPDRPARLLGWDGRRLDPGLHGAPGLILTSSALDQPTAEATRRAIFAAADHLDAERLDAIHRSHEPAMGPLSVCMHRPEASSVSLSRITVRPQSVRFEYSPGPPCTTSHGPPIHLTRMHSSALP